MDYRIHEEEVRLIDSCLFPIYSYIIIIIEDKVALITFWSFAPRILHRIVRG